MTRSLARLLTAAALTLCLAPAAFAQDDDDPAVLKPAEPDYTLGALPTNLRLPKYKSAFRVTHRFLGPLDEHGIGDLWGMESDSCTKPSGCPVFRQTGCVILRDSIH